MGNYDEYVSQVIRAGNCVTLLRESYPITVQSFWNINHFEKFAQSVFWTFNKSFLLKLLDRAGAQKPIELHRCRELLEQYPVAYPEPMPEDADDELKVCYLKNSNLKKSPKFRTMYSLDVENRKSILEAVNKRIAALFPPSSAPDPVIPSPVEPESTIPISFLSMVRPMNGTPEETLRFIAEQVDKAGIRFALFSPAERIYKNKNPYGLNGAMAATIRYFFERGYFNKEYSFAEVFKSYLVYSGNKVGKLPSFLENYQEDGHFQKYFDKLKDLKISKLQ
ncbi:MAG TPA: hypothetical protein VHE34_00755 [Puia sp.]|uniref:hypothetical protein n=1 Tax=Puia sp. TaxID=2045100 RepID=UPI002C71E796|nr:hypothetical protein [Puia sp.]HVU93714.1 hypothetical protein [Puia sp.]